MVFRRQWLSWSLGGLLLVGCGGAPPSPPPVAVDSGDETSGSFSSERAWQDLEALAGAGTRAPGSRGADAARAYITDALDWVGLSVEERVTPVEIEGLEPFDLTHLSVTIPGRSGDRFILAAGYDSDHFVEFENPGVNLGASGAALLIEVARVLADDTPEYTVQLLFIEGDGRLGLGERRTAEKRGLGSELLARQMQEAGELEGVRLLIAFKGVCDADLGIARDLFSQRHHREEFWRVARSLGYGDIFERDAIFQSVEAPHRAFMAQGLRSVVAVVDTAYGGVDPPGIYADGEDDVLEHCSPRSMRIVGTVTLRALDQIGARLSRVDEFTRRPLAVPVAEADMRGGAMAPAAAGGEGE
jgi:hypothetical protein